MNIAECYEASRLHKFLKILVITAMVFLVLVGIAGATKDSDAWKAKGVALDNLNKSDKAIKAYDKAIETNLRNASGWSNKVNTSVRLGKLDEAQRAWVKSKEIDSKAWYNKGTDLFYLDQFDGAIIAYDKAIEINPQDSNAWYNKGIALGKLGKLDEAIKAFDKVIDIKPHDSKAWYYKGVAFSALGKSNEAQKAWTKAKEINSKA